MRVINLALDNKILDKDSAVAKRAISYGSFLDEYFIIAPGVNKTVEFSENIKAVGIDGGNKFLTLFKIYQYLDEHLKNNHYDLITIQDSYYLASVGIHLGNKFNIKTEIQIHGFEKLTIFRKTLAKSNLQKANSIRTVSQRLKKCIADTFTVAQDKIYIVPIAIDKDKILLNNNNNINLKEKYPSSFIFLTVARLVQVKNIAIQIRALASLSSMNGHLVIVGDGPEKDNLEKLAATLGIAHRVHFDGWVDDLADYYSTADCLLLSSNSEGYGAVVAEAILAGLPVIMTDVGVAGELVKNETNGLVIPVHNQRAFTQAMLRVIEENGLLQNFSSNSYLFKDKILDKEELVKKVIDNWRKISNA